MDICSLRSYPKYPAMPPLKGKGPGAGWPNSSMMPEIISRGSLELSARSSGSPGWVESRLLCLTEAAPSARTSITIKGAAPAKVYLAEP